MGTRQETKYNKLVGIIDDEYCFLDYTFKDGDFMGACGTILQPITRKQYEYDTSEDSLLERLGEWWKNAVDNNSTELGKVEWVRDIYNRDGDDALYDLSGYDLWDQLRNIGLTEEDYPVFNCIGGGRCFDKNMKFDKVYDQKLVDIINQYEKKRERGSYR
jgi:hypothetical protein